MAKQKFSAIEREAIWLAHEKKCAYTRELIDVSSFHIDHILPESLNSNAVEFTQVVSGYGLSDDFDLFGFGNILPCKAGVNLQKGADLLGQSAIHFYLDLAGRKQSEVEHNIGKIQRRMSQGKAVILLQQLIETRKISINDLELILETCSKNPDRAFQLLSGMKFADQSEVATVYKTEIDQLMDRPVKFGRNDHVESIPMGHDTLDKIYVCTCREYVNAINAGYYVVGGVFIKMSAWLEHYSGLLVSLKAATMADSSYISNPRVGVSDLQSLPSSIFPFMETPEFDLTKYSYQDLIKKGIITVRRVSSNLLQVESDTMGQTLIEVVRADFNGDGIEDILLFEYCFATKGTMGYSNVLILTCKSQDSMLEVIPPVSYSSEHISKSLY